MTSMGPSLPGLGGLFEIDEIGRAVLGKKEEFGLAAFPDWWKTRLGQKTRQVVHEWTQSILNETTRVGGWEAEGGSLFGCVLFK